jgi:outer membrane receptor protein involved in Fe transport
MDYRLTFKRTVDPRSHELTAEVSFEQEDESEVDRYTENLLTAGGTVDNSVLEEQVVDQTEDGREFEAQVDYMRPLGDALRMEAGFNSEMEWLDNRFYSESLDLTSSTFQPDLSLNNTFAYNEQVHAAYGILGGELGPFGAQVGVRVEQVYTTFDLTTTGEAFDHHYFSAYPSAYLTYAPAEGRTVRLSYSKRVRRPNTWQLNPFGDYDDPTSRRVGNPYLDPQYTHAFEVSYSHIANAYTLQLAPYYRRTVDAISWSQRLTDDGVTLTTFENFATEDSYGLEVIGTLSLDRWLRTRGSFNLYQRDTNGSNVDSELSSSALGYSTRLSATASLPTGVKLELSQFYRSPMNVPGGHIDAFTRTDLAVQRDLMDGRASVSVRASDLFNTMGFNMWRESSQYYQTFERDFNAQALQVSLRYNFGQQDQSRRNRGGNYEGGGEAMDGMPMQ